LLLPPSDEQLSFAAITNKFGINQDGINDQNVFKGPIRLSNTPLLNSNSNYFLQTDASGNVSIQPAYTSAAIATYTGTVSFTATVAPSGATSHSFRWTQTGNLVTLNINLLFAVAGTVVTNVIATLPTGLPNPVIPTGFTGNNTPIQSGTGVTIGSLSSFALQQGSLYLSYNGTNWRINYPTGALATLGVSMTMQYFTS
jgi:hypothetical protein